MKARTNHEVAAVLVIMLGLALRVEAFNPVLLTNIAPNNGFGSLVISGKYLYSVGDALRVFDISNPANPINPIQLGATNLSGGGSGLVVSSNHAFVLEGSLFDYYGANLSVFDVSVAANPLKLNELSGGEFFSVATSQHYIYLGGGDGVNGYWLRVYDISSPITPINIAQIDSGRLNAIYALAVRGNSAYMLGSNTGLDIAGTRNLTELTCFSNG